MKFRKGILFLTLLVLSSSVSAGALELLKTMKTAKDGYGAYQSTKTIEGLENAKPIFTKVKRIYIIADTVPPKGKSGAMNSLVQKVLCDNIERIVDNLEKYDMEGATPKCKTGMPSKKSKKKEIIMRISQVPNKSDIELSVDYVDRVSNEPVKSLKMAPTSNYYVALVAAIDDLHGDFVVSSRTNNPISLKKWPKRFSKYSKKKKHREVSIKRKERKQLEANKAK